MKNIKITSLLLIAISLQACNQKKAVSQQQASESEPKINLSEQFGDYWYQGKAELTSYDLTQVRYGQKREGHAVLVFVTEDFSKEKQVKLDNPQANPEHAEKVMKLNFTKKFKTGIYPYSMMSSIFNPVYPENDLHAVKITTSVQEWCGHVFMQFNKGTNNYDAMIRSYFESEGDQNFSLPKAWSEDELWNLLRLDPSAIPSGNVKMIPSTMYFRLKHKQTAAYKASIEKDIQGENSSLIIKYPDLKRTVKINYQNSFPFKINSWEETYPENGEMMTTTGTLKKRIMLDYWNRNSVTDSTYREVLELN